MHPSNHPIDHYLRTPTRRQLFQRVGMGVGGFALAELMGNDLGARSAGPLSHFAPKAKSVIYFHLVGAPSHLDLFDYKPALQARGELCPKEMFEGKQLAFIRSRPTLLGTPNDGQYQFNHAGNRALKYQAFCPTCKPAPTRCALSAPCTQMNSTTLRPKCSCRPGSVVSGVPVSACGPITDLGP